MFSLLFFQVCLFLIWITAHVIGLPLLSSPLDIVRRSKTHACPTITLVSCLCYTRLLLFDPACVLTMFTNKSLHLDPLASCPVGAVTEYSATRGSRGFSKEPWPGMDPFDQLLDLRQISLSIEEYVTQFCELSYRAGVPNRGGSRPTRGPQ